MLTGLLGGAFFAFAWWYLRVSKGNRYWTIGLPLLIFPGGFFNSMTKVAPGTWSPVTGLAYALVVAVAMIPVGVVIDLWRRHRARGSGSEKPGSLVHTTAVGHQAPDDTETKLNQSQPLEVLEVTPTPSHQNAASTQYKAFLIVLALPILLVAGIVWLPSDKSPAPLSSDGATQSPTLAMAANDCASLINNEDFQAAFTSCRTAAEQGDAYAQVNLGWMYSTGTGTPKDATEAIIWYRLAAQQGDAIAQYNLGANYENGSGVKQDLAEATKWYRLAAAQGDADAKARLEALSPPTSSEGKAEEVTTTSLANLTRDDFAEAQQIARAGYPNAKVSHLVGPDIPRGARYSGFIIGLDPSPADALAIKGDFVAAKSLYLKLYSQNSDPDAAHNLGLIYARGLDGEKDPQKALRFLNFSSENRQWDADSWEIDKLSK